MSATLTPAQLAETFGTTGREVRKFLRSVTPKDEHPGKGSRWAIPGSKRDVTRLQKQYNEWHAKQLEERAARAQAAAEAAAEEVSDEVEELDEE